MVLRLNLKPLTRIFLQFRQCHIQIFQQTIANCASYEKYGLRSREKILSISV